MANCIDDQFDPYYDILYHARHYMQISSVILLQITIFCLRGIADETFVNSLICMFLILFVPLFN